jgi:hypothetical protein
MQSYEDIGSMEEFPIAKQSLSLSPELPQVYNAKIT